MYLGQNYAIGQQRKEASKVLTTAEATAEAGETGTVNKITAAIIIMLGIMEATTGATGATAATAPTAASADQGAIFMAAMAIQITVVPVRIERRVRLSQRSREGAGCEVS